MRAAGTHLGAIGRYPGDVLALVKGRGVQFALLVNGMKPSDPPLAGPKNDPMMPLAWLRDYKTESGKTARIFTTTMGAAVDLESGDTGVSSSCLLSLNCWSYK